MGNSYFKFKQFAVEQGDCAMKVSTDACIQGAWTAIKDDAKTVLDVGAGTGLLSLMLAQKNSVVRIDAVEIDAAAAAQAKGNFIASPWAERLSVECEDIKVYSKQRYDMIISNPPFFNNSLLGNTAARNVARHTDNLEYHDLLKAIGRLLNEGGFASVLLPATEFALFEKMLQENGWFVFDKLKVCPVDGAGPNRIVGIFKRGTGVTVEETLTIKKKDGSYTNEFIKLLQPYYLYL